MNVVTYSKVLQLTLSLLQVSEVFIPSNSYEDKSDLSCRDGNILRMIQLPDVVVLRD
jgi:hypothetical protein